MARFEDDRERYADKIAKLLRKAEGNTTPEEAEALVAKAQELMTQYAIDEELLARARGQEVEDKVVEKHITYKGVYSAALYNIGRAVARANGCKTLISKMRGGTILYVVGMESDVERVKMLDASVQIQATSALVQWASDGIEPWMTPMEKFKTRREFLFGFASGLTLQLTAARKAGERQAAEAEAARLNEDDAVDREAAKETASESVALVVRTRKQRVDDWYDERYGGTTRTVSRNYSSGGYGAASAGSEAGRRADVSGRGRVGGSARQLGA